MKLTASTCRRLATWTAASVLLAGVSFHKAISEWNFDRQYPNFIAMNRYVLNFRANKMDDYNLLLKANARHNIEWAETYRAIGFDPEMLPWLGIHAPRSRAD